MATSAAEDDGVGEGTGSWMWLASGSVDPAPGRRRRRVGRPGNAAGGTRPTAATAAGPAAQAGLTLGPHVYGSRLRPRRVLPTAAAAPAQSKMSCVRSVAGAPAVGELRDQGRLRRRRPAYRGGGRVLVSGLADQAAVPERSARIGPVVNRVGDQLAGDGLGRRRHPAQTPLRELPVTAARYLSHLGGSDSFQSAVRLNPAPYGRGYVINRAIRQRRRSTRHTGVHSRRFGQGGRARGISDPFDVPVRFSIGCVV